MGMMPLRGRRAVFFSLSALVVVGALFIVLNAQPLTQETPHTFLRIQDIRQDMVALTEYNVPEMVRTHARQSLQMLARQATTAPYDNLSALRTDFGGCMTGSQCGGEAADDNLQVHLDDLSVKYEDLQYDADVSILSANVSQIGTWELLVSAEVSVRLSDEAGIARIQRPMNITVRLPIYGLIDPFASRMLGDTRTVRRASFRVDESWNAVRTVEHAEAGTYRQDLNGTYYLSRFLAAPETHPNGFSIHSLMPAGHFGTEKRSYVDVESESFTVSSENCLIPAHDAGHPELWLSEPYALRYNITSSEEIAGRVCA